MFGRRLATPKKRGTLEAPRATDARLHYLLALPRAVGGSTREARWIKDRIKRTFPKNCKAFLTEALLTLKIVSKLPLYQSRPVQIPGPDLLNPLFEQLVSSIAGAYFRDTRQVALRNQTMREISAAFDKIFSYLESMATEDDFTSFRSLGLILVTPGGRKPASRRGKQPPSA